MFAFGRTALLAGTCLLLSDVCVVVRSVRCLQKCFVLKRCVSWCWKGVCFWPEYHWLECVDIGCSVCCC